MTFIPLGWELFMQPSKTNPFKQKKVKARGSIQNILFLRFSKTNNAKRLSLTEQLVEEYKRHYGNMQRSMYAEVDENSDWDLEDEDDER